MGIRAKLFAAFFAIICFGSIPLRAENPVKEKQDRFSLAVGITKEQGDSILRADLRKLCRMFSYLGRDSLIVAVLSYNVGAYRLKGYGKMPKSSLLKKLEAGDRNIYKEYVSFRCYKGKVVPSIERRRKVEYMLLFEE